MKRAKLRKTPATAAFLIDHYAFRVVRIGKKKIKVLQVFKDDDVVWFVGVHPTKRTVTKEQVPVRDLSSVSVIPYWRK